MDSPGSVKFISVFGERGHDRTDGPVREDEFVTEIDGNLVTDEASLMAVIAEALRFPSDFGGNWNALHDCLSDLEWIPASSYTIWWSNASCLLVNAPSVFATFLEVFAESAAWWHSQGRSLWLYIIDDVVLHLGRMLQSHVSIGDGGRECAGWARTVFSGEG